MQWLLFSGISVAAVVTLLRQGRSTPSSGRLDRGLVGETVVLTTEIEPGGAGQAEFRGSVWRVENAGRETLEVGARCRVDEVNGITLTVGRTSAELEEIERWSS